MYLLIVSLILVLYGCATTKEVESNSIVEPQINHNKYIYGFIRGNKYIGKNYSFSIEIPFKRGTKEYELMEIHEHYNKNNVNITFTVPGKYNSSYYLTLIKKGNEKNSNKLFEKKSDKLFKQYYQGLPLYYKSDKFIETKYNYLIHGKNSIHWNLKNIDSSRKGLHSNFSLIEHQVFTINLKQYLVFISVKRANTFDKKNNITAYEFIHSLSLLKNTSRLDILSTLTY